MHRLGITLTLLLLGACRATLPVYTVHVPPRWEEARPPARSVLFVSTSVPIDGIEDELDRATSRGYDADRRVSLGALSVHAKVHLEREPASLRAIEGGLELAVVARGRVEVDVGPLRCAADDVRVEASAAGRPALEGSSLALVSAPRMSARVIGHLDCAGFAMPLDSLLDPLLLGLTAGLERVAGLARVPVAPALRLALDELAVPRPITIDDRAACLDLAPSAIVVSPVGGHGGPLVIRIGIDVAPRVSPGECPRQGQRLLDAILAREQPLDDEMSIQVALAIPHDTIQPVLTRALVGRRFGSGGRAVTIDAVEVGDASGRVLVRAHVHGRLHGELYLWGTPTLVTRDGRLVVEVPDLRVALDTEHVLERVALALWRSIDGGLLEAVRPKLRFDVTDRVHALAARVPAQLERAMLGGHVQLRVEVHRVEPVAVLSRPGLVVPIVRLEGRATATMR